MKDVISVDSNGKHGASNHTPTRAEIKDRRKKQRLNKKKARKS